MNLVKLTLIAAFFSVITFSVQAQNVKPVFKKLVFVTYRPTIFDHKKSVRIEDYLEIDENGMFRNIANRYDDDYGNHLSYKGRMWDTIYRMPDSIITKLNKVFNGRKRLTEYMVTDKLPKGANYAGPFEFLTYTDNDNKIDNLVIVMGFLDNELNDLLEKFWHLPSANIKQNDKIYRNKPFEAEVAKYHYACKYVPPIVEPPRVMELEAPAPSAKH